MADQKIELEIVLDDGSIKKAFGTIKKEAKEAGDESGKAFGGLGGFGGSLVVLNQGIELFTKMASTIKAVGQEMINLSLEAEKVRVTQSQFASFTQQAGIATQAFDEAIQESVAGLIDDDQALQIANQAMIRLGASAQKLPEIFELSRKAAAAGFGDIVSNTEALTNAIQTGQTRQLRSIGIIVDITKAQNDFAKSIGTTKEFLTEQQKTFANSQAILEAASKKFSNVDENVAGLSLSLQRLKVASTEAFERFAIGFDKAFGPTIKAFIDALTISINGNGNALKVASVTANYAGTEIERLEKKLVSLQERLATAKTETQFNLYQRQINDTSEQLSILNKKFAELDENQMKSAQRRAQAVAQSEQQSDAVRQRTAEQEAARQLQRQESLIKYNEASNAFQQQEIASRQSSLQFMVDSDAKDAEREALHQEQLKFIVDKGIQDRAVIEKNFSDAKLITQAERDALVLQQVEAQNAAVSAAQQKFQQDSMGDFDRFVQRSQKSFKQIGDAAKITFVSQIGGAFASFGAALAKGEDAMAAFGNAILGILGDIAIQMGTSFILQGIGWSANPVTPGAGAGLVAAGVALSIFGGVLKGLAGGSPGASSATSGAGSSGGGISGNGFADTTVGLPAGFDATRVSPNTVVNFTIQGDVLDSDGTQNRIVQLLNDAIDTKGAVVRGI